jgi:hypothetical protein
MPGAARARRARPCAGTALAPAARLAVRAVSLRASVCNSLRAKYGTIVKLCHIINFSDLISLAFQPMASPLRRQNR